MPRKFFHKPESTEAQTLKIPAVPQWPICMETQRCSNLNQFPALKQDVNFRPFPNH